jgi:hypothetical protein
MTARSLLLDARMLSRASSSGSPLLLPSLALLIATLTVAPAGCSSTEPPGGGGGQQGGGGTGAGGHGGTTGVDAGQSCASLISDYAAAFADAQLCNPFLTIVQCTRTASPSLQCPNCMVHVNDTTRLDAIRAAYQARTDCIVAPCPAILCVLPASGTCQASDSGATGTCVDIR